MESASRSIERQSVAIPSYGDSPTQSQSQHYPIRLQNSSQFWYERKNNLCYRYRRQTHMVWCQVLKETLGLRTRCRNCWWNKHEFQFWIRRGLCCLDLQILEIWFSRQSNERECSANLKSWIATQLVYPQISRDHWLFWIDPIQQKEVLKLVTSCVGSLLPRWHLTNFCF